MQQPIYLHIEADFDENGLTRKTYKSLDEFVKARCDEFETFQGILDHIKACEEEGTEPEYQATYCRELICTGEVEGEWHTEMFFEIKGTIQDGI